MATHDLRTWVRLASLCSELGRRGDELLEVVEEKVFRAKAVFQVRKRTRSRRRSTVSGTRRLRLDTPTLPLSSTLNPGFEEFTGATDYLVLTPRVKTPRALE